MSKTFRTVFFKNTAKQKAECTIGKTRRRMAELAHKGKTPNLLSPMACCNLNMQGVQRNPATSLVYTPHETGW